MDFSEFALEQGIVVVDTKLEVFVDSNGQWVIGDEILTPESSRFISKENFDNGEYISMDKQILRNFAIKHNWKEKAKSLEVGQKLKVEVPDSIKNDILKNYEIIYNRMHK